VGEILRPRGDKGISSGKDAAKGSKMVTGEGAETGSGRLKIKEDSMTTGAAGREIGPCSWNRTSRERWIIRVIGS
jgi:hypothetical protein